MLERWMWNSGPRFDDENDFFEPTGYGNRYTFNNEGTTVYGLGGGLWSKPGFRH